jgi:DNA-binding SARP family transcriptional activator/predicted ATPase
MSPLTLKLFGGFRLALDNVPVEGRLFTKTQALVAYLALEAGRPHRREVLAGLLWPESPEKAARASLRQALRQIRHVLGMRSTACFDVSPNTIEFDQQADCWVDAIEFMRILGRYTARGNAARNQTPHQPCHECVILLKSATELYSGDLLAGFALKDSSLFEEWAQLKREQFRRQALSSLYELAETHARQGAHEATEALARKQVAIDPLAENAHRQILRSLLSRGQYGLARRHYEGLCKMLEEEWAVTPEVETSTLVRHITGERSFLPIQDLPPPVKSATSHPRLGLPSFLQTIRPELTRHLVFVGRKAELARLDALAEQAFDGQGQVVFVSGEAGLGKTALLKEFASRAQVKNPDLILAGGNGNAQVGIGDPYLPFREILALLTGSVEPRWTAGGMSLVQAQRLWNLIPLTICSLLEAGPDLVGTFLPIRPLLQRATRFAAESSLSTSSWLPHLRRLAERKASLEGSTSIQQIDLFEQYSCTLQNLAQAHPLLLILDDLQWVDTASASLLFHLGRRLDGHRIMLVGAYRPGEVARRVTVSGSRARTRDERECHPLELILIEFKRRWGDIEVSLDQDEDQHFVDLLIDREPNKLGGVFRHTLFQQTRGHPLFVIELLLGMQARGDLVKDLDGCWIEGPTRDWDTLPARVEAVIAERFTRLPLRLHNALSAASVEGEVFTAEVLARVQAAGQGRVRRWLSGDLDEQHSLVQAEEVWHFGNVRLARYRFRHTLYQKYLYQTLNEVERVCLHEAVGQALEELYGESAGEIALQLAWHYQRAGLIKKAIHYLQLGGERALHMAANQQAAGHFIQALRLFEAQPDYKEQPELELQLQMSCGTALQAIRGYGDEQVGESFTRALALCQQIGEIPQLFPARWLLASFFGARSEHEISKKIMAALIQVGERAKDPLLIALGHWGLGWNKFFTGEWDAARFHLTHMLLFYEPGAHHKLAHTYGQDPGVVTRSCLSLVLWSLGYPDQAKRIGQEAISLARSLEDPFSLALALTQVGLFYAFSRDFDTLAGLAEECMSLCDQHGFSYWKGAALMCYGWVRVASGQLEQGIATTIEGMTAYEATGAYVSRIQHIAILAEAYARAGEIHKSFELLEEARQMINRTGENYFTVEVARITGDVYLQLPDPDQMQAESWYRHAIEIAQNQAAKSWELRATVSLCRLWQQQGKTSQAKDLLGEIYAWFNEGFETADLLEAQQLIILLA